MTYGHSSIWLKNYVLLRLFSLTVFRLHVNPLGISYSFNKNYCIISPTSNQWVWNPKLSTSLLSYDIMASFKGKTYPGRRPLSQKNNDSFPPHDYLVTNHDLPMLIITKRAILSNIPDHVYLLLLSSAHHQNYHNY